MATHETRGVAERLPGNLQRDNARQTHNLAQIKQTLSQMQVSMGAIKESLTDVATNSLAVITCLIDLQTATTGVDQEVSALTQAVEANTRAGQVSWSYLLAGFHLLTCVGCHLVSWGFYNLHTLLLLLPTGRSWLPCRDI